MNEYALKQAAQGLLAGNALGKADVVMHNPTLAENIDNRISILKNQVERLERVKALLQEPAGILNVPIDDLRFAMNY